MPKIHWTVEGTPERTAEDKLFRKLRSAELRLLGATPAVMGMYRSETNRRNIKKRIAATLHVSKKTINRILARDYNARTALRAKRLPRISWDPPKVVAK